MPIACTHCGASGRCRHPWHDQNAIAHAVSTTIAEHGPGCHKDYPGACPRCKGKRKNIELVLEQIPPTQ